MKSLAITLALMFAVATSFAEVDAQAFKVIGDIQKGVDNANQIKTLRVGAVTTAGVVVAGGTNTLTAVNAPAVVSKTAPIWVVFNVNGTNCVVAAYPKQ